MDFFKKNCHQSNKFPWEASPNMHLDPKKGQHAMKGLQGLKVISHHKK